MLKNTEPVIGTNYCKTGMENKKSKEAMQKSTENTASDGITIYIYIYI